MGQNFSIWQAFKFGWDTTVANLKFLLGAMLVYYGISIIPAVFFRGLESSGLLMVVQGVLMGLTLIIGLGLIRISLKLYDKKETSYRDLFNVAYLVVRALVGYIITSLVFLPCLIPFVISGLATPVRIVLLVFILAPVVYVSVRLSFFDFFIVDRETGPITALRLSFALTHGYFMDLFFFGVLMAVIYLAGIAALLVGLLVATPVTMVARAYLFRKLAEIRGAHTGG